jgi:hypothetical protein
VERGRTRVEEEKGTEQRNREKEVRRGGERRWDTRKRLNNFREGRSVGRSAVQAHVQQVLCYYNIRISFIKF